MLNVVIRRDNNLHFDAVQKYQDPHKQHKVLLLEKEQRKIYIAFANASIN